LFTLFCLDVEHSQLYVQLRTTIVILGALYERIGRFVGRSYDDMLPTLLNLLKNGDSQMRFEIFRTLERSIHGQTTSITSNIQREISKVARTHLCDRVMSVRSASAMVSSH
jgi:HEAT repeat-containing protein 5